MNGYGSSLRVEVKGDRLNSYHRRPGSIDTGTKAGIFVDDPTNRPMPLTGGRSIPFPSFPFRGIRRSLSGDSDFDNGLAITSLSPEASTWLCKHCSYPNSESASQTCALCGNKSCLSDSTCKTSDDGSLATRSTRTSHDDSSSLPSSPSSLGSSTSNHKSTDDPINRKGRSHSAASEQQLQNKNTQPVHRQQLSQGQREEKVRDRVVTSDDNLTPANTPSIHLSTALGARSTPRTHVNHPSGGSHTQAHRHTRQTSKNLPPHQRSQHNHLHDEGARVLPQQDREIIIKETQIARTTNGVVNVFRRGKRKMFGRRRASTTN